MAQLKFGKKPATEDKRDLKLADFVDKTVLPTSFPKPNFGNGTLFSDWEMLGNGPDPSNPAGSPDGVGDCVIASRAHLTMLDTKVGAPATARFTAESAISEYSKLSGYVPGDESTDVGLDMRAVCSYQKRYGLLDADGNRHKIGAYLTFPPGDGLLAMQAIWIFGGYAHGFSVPESAIEQFDKGEIWDDVGDTNILGGHEVCAVGTMDWKTKQTVITWARRQEMTFRFMARYNDENFCWVAPEILNLAGLWRGLNVLQLNDALRAI
jgi:hypothetical protein